jgi:hypothetical protein
MRLPRPCAESGVALHGTEISAVVVDHVVEFSLGNRHTPLLAPIAKPTKVVAKGGFDFKWAEFGDFLAEHGCHALAIFGAQRWYSCDDARSPQKEYFTFERGELFVDLADIAEIANGALAWLTAVVTEAFDEIRIKKRYIGRISVFVMAHYPADVHTAVLSVSGAV